MNPTGGPNLLVVVLEDGQELPLQRAVEERVEYGARVRIVVPARIGPLQWLATDVDRARAEAEVRALTSEWSLHDLAQVEGMAGDEDLVLAVEDALRGFPATEILVVGGDETETEASLGRFGLPVTRIATSTSARLGRRGEGMRALLSGRSNATPLVMFAGVNLALLVLALLLSLLVILIVWLL